MHNATTVLFNGSGQSVPVTCTTLASHLLCIHPDFLPLVIYIWDLLPWVHFPLYACTEDWNLMKKNCRALFQYLQRWKRTVPLCKAMGFPACRDLEEPRVKPTYSASLCCGMHNTTWNAQRGIWQSGMWILLNISSCAGMWPRAAPSNTMTESGIRANGIRKSQLWTALLPIYFLAAHCKCKLDLGFWMWCSKMTWHLN